MKYIASVKDEDKNEFIVYLQGSNEVIKFMSLVDETSFNVIQIYPIGELYNIFTFKDLVNSYKKTDIITGKNKKGRRR